MLKHTSFDAQNLDTSSSRQPGQRWLSPGLCPSNLLQSFLLFSQSHLEAFSAASELELMALILFSPVMLRVPQASPSVWTPYNPLYRHAPWHPTFPATVLQQLFLFSFLPLLSLHHPLLLRYNELQQDYLFGGLWDQGNVCTEVWVMCSGIFSYVSKSTIIIQSCVDVSKYIGQRLCFCFGCFWSSSFLLHQSLLLLPIACVIMGCGHTTQTTLALHHSP